MEEEQRSGSAQKGQKGQKENVGKGISAKRLKFQCQDCQQNKIKTPQETEIPDKEYFICQLKPLCHECHEKHAKTSLKCLTNTGALWNDPSFWRW